MRKGLFQQQATRVLQQEKYALLLATVLAAMPFLNWLALSIVALVTLRHGAKSGLQVLLPVCLMHILVFVFSMPLKNAIALGLLNALPTFIAAAVLKATMSWQKVAAAWLGLVAVVMVILEVFVPQFALMQYAHLEVLVKPLAVNGVHPLAFWVNRGVSSDILAHYVLGIQAMALAFSSTIPLFFARSLQAQLFYPGGFKEEMQHFRGDKRALAALALLVALAYSGRTLAIDCLPLVLFCFMLSGLSFGAYVFSSMRPLALVLLLIAPLVFLSWVFLPLYALLGILDSLFNFRLYLSVKTGKVA